tara:strand:- start:34929 stop:35261 length:333 start_codon:yes stop_codon:yes gene_type:complete
MNKTTRITDYQTQSALQQLGVKLSNPLDVKNLTQGTHAFEICDHCSAYASGVLENKENYQIEFSVGDNITVDGIEAKVKDLVFPHIMLETAGDVIRLHFIELIASKIREG